MRWFVLLILLVSCSEDEDMKLFMGSLGGAAQTPSFPENGVRLIIITGQSNADGRANQAQLTTAERDPQPQAKIWTGSAFATYDYGVNDDGDGTSSADHGWDPLFAYQFNTYFPGETVYMVKHAVGGTAIIEHLSGGSVYTVLEPRVTNAINNLIASGKQVYPYFFFSQGERDANIGTTGATYYSRYESLISLWRTNLGVTNISWVTTEILLDCYPNEPIINAELNNIGTNYEMISTIPMKNLTDVGDGLHFDTQAIRDSMSDIWSHWTTYTPQPITTSI